MGEEAGRSTTAGWLARAVHVQGRSEEAVELSHVGERPAAPEDVWSHAGWRSVRAVAYARLGRLDEAERLARDAVAMSSPTDSLFLRANALVDLADVLSVMGAQAEMQEVLDQAPALFRRQGNVVMSRAG